jgi:arylsulfatase A-like enzyme
MLANYGYVSGIIGKLHFLPHANRDHREPHPGYGFDHLEVSDEPGEYEDAYRAWVRSKAPDQLDYISPALSPAAKTWYELMEIEDTVKHPGVRWPKKAQVFRGPSHLTHSAFVAEQSTEFISKHRHNQPWLLVASFYSPHMPWIAPQEFLSLYDPSDLSIPKFPPGVDEQRSRDLFSDEELRSVRHGYYAMISEVDHHVGRLLNVLEQTGAHENTIIVFSSDHGEWLGEHLRYDKGYPGDDSVSRVPLIVHWPRASQAGRHTVRDIVEAVDVVPTVLDCAGIQPPPNLRGRSLRPLLEGGRLEFSRPALTEHHGWKAIRTEGYRYICESSGAEHLYDLPNDPREYSNVADDPNYTDVKQKLRKAMLTRVLEIETPLSRTYPY